MRLTTERKVCAGVLSLAVVALGVDRFVLGGAAGPSGAAAAVASTEPAQPPTPPAGKPPTGTPVRDQLAVLVTPGPSPDAFEPSARWSERIHQARLAAEAATRKDAPASALSQEEPDWVKRFQRHQLTTILEGKGGSENMTALIKVALDESGRTESRLFRPGDTLDGFRLTRLGQGAAVFEDQAGGRTIELTLPAPGSGPRGGHQPEGDGKDRRVESLPQPRPLPGR